MRRGISYLISLGILLAGMSVYGQETKSTFWQKFNPDSLVNRPLHVLPLPIFRTSPETGFQTGVSVDYFFNADTLPTTRSSYAWIQALYSTRRQLVVEPAWQVFTKDEKYFLRGKSGYVIFSENFWGVGHRTLPEDDYLNASYNRTYF